MLPDTGRYAKCSVQQDLQLVSPRGFEPLAFGFGGRRSIQLSYGDKHMSHEFEVNDPKVILGVRKGFRNGFVFHCFPEIIVPRAGKSPLSEFPFCFTLLGFRK